MNTPNGIEALPNGQWTVAGDTHLGAWAKQHGSIITDPHLFAWLKPRLGGVKVVWDIGANIGDHARAYLDWGMRVVAIEPNPLAFLCLQHNCPEANNVNIAASDEVGELRFTQFENVGASRVTKDGDTTVKAYTLDMLTCLDAPDFVKLDCEGWEVHALRGMIGTLKEHQPIIFVEVNKGALAANGHTRDDIVTLLKEAGYTSFTSYPENVSQDGEQFDLFCTK